MRARLAAQALAVILGSSLVMSCAEAEKAPSVARSKDLPYSSAGASGSAKVAASAGRGLAAPGNDAKVIELARKAMTCKWDGRGLSQDCTPAVAWGDASEGFADGKADPTLVSMLDDPEERARWLAATKLHATGRAFRADKALAERVVTAAERETSPHVGAALGIALADIQLERTASFDRIRAMGVKHALVPLRAALIANIAWRNPGSSAAYELTREMVRDPEKDVRAAAISAFYMGGGRQPEVTCRIWLDNLDNAADEDVAAAASEYIARWGRCQAHYEALLEAQEKRHKAAKTDSPRHAAGLGFLCEDVKSQARQRERANELLRKIAETKTYEPDVRAGALEAILKCDADGSHARAFVTKFTTEPPAQLKERAIDLLRPKKR